MAESERVHEREGPPLGDNPYERIHIPIQEFLASDLQQTENSPDFKEG